MFEIGKKVVCINVDETATTAPLGLKQGKTYTVIAITICSCGCGSENLHLLEVQKLVKLCSSSGVNMGSHRGYLSTRFKPFNESWVEDLLEKINIERDFETNELIYSKSRMIMDMKGSNREN